MGWCDACYNLDLRCGRVRLGPARQGTVRQGRVGYGMGPMANSFDTDGRAQLIARAVESGLIDPEHHAPLLERLDHWARVSGVAPEDVLEEGAVGERERAWLKHWRKGVAQNVCGLVYLGPFKRIGVPGVIDHMRAMAGAYLRQYVDARIVSLANATSWEYDGDPTVLLIPDSGESYHKTVTDRFGPLLIDRARKRKITIVHFEQSNHYARYGNSAAALLESFARIQI